MVSKITRDESAVVEGTNLASNLCVIYFALDVYYSNSDLVLVGENQKEFVRILQKVIIKT